MNDVIVTYYKKQVLVPKEIADFLELDRKRKQAEERQDRRHLSKGILETVLACGNPHLRPTEAKALKNLLLKNLRAAVAELDEQDRYLLALRYRDELSMEAIGKIMGISKTAVSKRLKKLHEMLKGSVISRTLHFFCKFRFTSLFPNVLSYRRFFYNSVQHRWVGKAYGYVLPLFLRRCMVMQYLPQRVQTILSAIRILVPLFQLGSKIIILGGSLLKNFETLYDDHYSVNNNCLYAISTSSKGTREMKLCNFVPWLVREITVDDGLETKTHITLSGIHEDGRTLPEVEIPAEELASFNWLCNSWSIDCILEPGKNIKDSLRYAIQTTAHQAERTTVYTVTGWREINGEWFYLMPGDDLRTVSLPGKMGGYGMERYCDEADISSALSLLNSGMAPDEILYPMMAFAFLSPLNHFLKLAGHEPKFVLFLVGKTGSRKSTLAALFLSFFGRFTGAELPLSFQDTANSIIQNSFNLKDVLTCIDDFHPSGRNDEQKLTDTAQKIMRAYGDRTGRSRLRADSSLMDSRPPQGNAIITAEFPPDIGESGTARYFSLELGSNDVDLDLLSAFQRLAADGTLQRCMFGFTEWLRETWLNEPNHFTSVLKKNFEHLRDAFRKSCPNCHGRVPEAAAWLEIGMMMFLSFLSDRLGAERTAYNEHMEKFRAILLRLAARQADSITEDKPTHKFVQKLYALLESNTVCVLDKKSPPEFTPANCIGYEDADFFYLYTEIAHKSVRKLCEEQGESFSLSSRLLLKALSEEGWIETADGQNTKPVRIGKHTKRMMWLSKEKTRAAGIGMF